MISYNDIKTGDCIKVDNDPFTVLSLRRIQMQQTKPTVEMRLKNLKTGQVVTKTFKSQHNAEEAEIKKEPIVFIYANRGEYWFHKKGDKSQRFALKDEFLGQSVKFLKTDLEVEALKFNGEIINIDLPIKIEYMVVEAPPSVKGNTASGGTKSVIIDSISRASVNAPLFINQDDIIRVNTQTGEYAERVEKSSSI